MALSFSTGLRNDLLDGSTAVDTTFNSGYLDIYSGSQPANADATDDQGGAATRLARVDLPADAFAAVSGGSMALTGTWQEASAIAPGTAAWFRLRTSADSADPDGASTTLPRIDGNITASGGGGDLELSSTTIAALDQVTIDTFTVSVSAT